MQPTGLLVGLHELNEDNDDACFSRCEAEHQQYVHQVDDFSSRHDHHLLSEMFALISPKLGLPVSLAYGCHKAS